MNGNIAAGGAGTGTTGALSNLLKSKLFLQFLSGAGGAIGGEGSFADKINQMNQQNIAAQSMAGTQNKYLGQINDMLSMVLGGDENMPEDMKATIDSKGLNLKVGKNTLNSRAKTMTDKSGQIAPGLQSDTNVGLLNPFQ